MKTRCKNHGSKKRTESLNKKDTPSVAPKEDLAGIQQPLLRDTRFQKQVAKVSSENDHADSTTKDSSCISVVENETSNLYCPGVSTRSSTRPNKRQRCLSPSVEAVGSKDTKAVISASNATGGAMKGQRKKKKKEKRQWESWGPEDKDTFFEALHAYGKDFDKVQNFIATRQKRRGEVPSLVKNKDQVRHFYYRTLNKISKYIPAEKLGENDTQKKTLYELLSLICYGELRKKMQGVNEKLGKKLNELINDGATSIRYNQRNIRIKAPACRALKKLLDDGETQPPPIPSKLVIEIVPLDNTAWTTVQRLAKNPRLRTTVSSKKQINSLLYYLKSKWPLVSASEETLEICFVVPTEFDSSNICESADAVPTNPPPMVSQCDSSPKDTKKVEDTNLSSDKASAKEQKCNKPIDLVDTSESMDCGKENRPSSLVHSNVDVDLIVLSEKETQDDGKDVQDCEMVAMENSPEKNTPKEQELKYWNHQNCGSVTVGDVYCKVGRPSKVKLKYCWKVQNDSKRNWNQDALQKLLKVATTEFKEIKENKRSENSKSLTSKQNMSTKVSSSNAQSKKTKIAPKRNERLPFLLPSVVPSSVSDSKKVSLSPPIRPIPRARKQQRKSAPVIVPKRTLLPRPANTVPTVAATAVPPGAVAVSFIPQPGQAVGTILAAGLPTTSVATVTSQLSTNKHSASSSPGLSSSSGTLETPVLSPALTQSSSPAPANSSESMSTSCHPKKSTINLSELSLDNTSPVIQQIQTSTSAAVTSAVSEPSLSVQARSQGNSVLDNFDLDSFVSTPVRNGETEGTTSDSIIGLALGSVLNHSSTMPSAAISEDSASEFLTNFLSTSSKDADSCRVSEGLFISSGENATSPQSAIHIEELNSGIAGGTPVTLANGAMGDANISLFSQISSSETFVAGEVKCTTITTAPSMGPADILCSTTNGERISENVLMTGSMLPEVSPLAIHSPGPESQWLNGEAGDISMSSILDKLVTSPDKRTENFGLSSLPVEIRDSASQDSLLSSRLMDMDTAFNVMMEENSVDYIKKFQDLTNRMAGPAQGNSPHSSSQISDLSKDPTSTTSDSTVSFSNFFSKHNR